MKIADSLEKYYDGALSIAWSRNNTHEFSQVALLQ